FPTLHELREHLKNNPKGAELLARLETEIPIKENPRAIPSLWYIPLVGGENFFDGFGFAPFRRKYGWKQEIKLDAHEKRFPPKRPLLPFLASLNTHLPNKWDRKLSRFVRDDDWLWGDVENDQTGGKQVDAIAKRRERAVSVR